MTKRIVSVGACLLAALLISSCTKTTPTGGGATPKTSTIFGWVERSDDFTKVPSVLVYDVSGMAAPDTTKADGSFKLTYQLTDNYTGTLVASRVTFGNDTINFTLTPGANDTLPRILILKADTTSQKTQGTAGIVASIVLVAGGDVTSIAIRGTGFAESTPLTFEARDSLGIPAGVSNKTRIYFSILGGPNGGEYVYPTSAVTDLTGRVVTRVTSGTKPGVVQIYAYAKPDTANPNFVVTSSPVRLTISGGLPDVAHFSMSVQKLNIAGISYDNLRDGISVLVGDKDGNPVQPGTAIYFSTTGGIIQPSATTDKDGAASVSLISSNPRPANGQVFVTARTIGDSGASISRTGMILFTGKPVISGPASNFQIVDSGSYFFSYKVSDANGNPLSSGNTITVTKNGPGSGDLDLQGDVSKTTIDTQDTTQTVFSVQVQDKTRGGASGLITFTITVTGSNGTASYTWTGTQLAAGESPIGTSTGIAAGIQLLGASASTVSVRGTGASETATLSFQVRDSLGNPITAPNSVPLSFAIQNGPGGGEYLFPPTAITDANGKASTTLSSGTKSGVVQLIASTTLSNGLVIQSAPVPLTIASGLADPAHSTMWLTPNVVNLPLSISPPKNVGAVNVQLGDRYGNPAQPSAVYFTTGVGLITSSAYTSISNPTATVTLVSGPPFASIDTITSITQGENGQNITQRIVVTASGSTILAVPAYPTGNLPALADGGLLLFTFDVKDANNNPIAANNAISVTALGDASVVGQLGFSINGSGPSLQTIDTRDTAAVHYSLKVTDNSPNAGSGGAFSLVIKSDGPNGSATKTLSGYLQAPGVIGGGGGGGGTGSQTGYTSSIILASVSATDISVQGTGSNETATLIFQSKDSLGQNVDQPHGSMIHFNISSPTLGALLTIDSMQSDASGRATTLLRSGTISGVIQVVASTTVPTGQYIVSLPIRISINSGLPDQNHFTIGAKQLNFPGLRYNGLTDAITIQMGDKYGNPVQSGTVAYFTTNHGIIQTTAATSSSDGFISKNLFSANPRPEGAFAIAAGNGWSYVTVSTFGSSGTVVSDSVKLLWTGPPIVTYTTQAFALANGGSAGPYTFTVQDLYGHPMSAGTSISIAASGLAIVSNAPVGGMPDVQASGPGLTSFTYTVSDGDPSTTLLAPSSTSVILTVSHPIYGSISYILANGTYQ